MERPLLKKYFKLHELKYMEALEEKPHARAVILGATFGATHSSILLLLLVINLLVAEWLSSSHQTH